MTTIDPRPPGTLFQTLAEIASWLNAQNIKNYRIDEDLTVHCDNYVAITQKIEYLPVNFGRIDGSFHVEGLGLKSLMGSPKSLEGGFYCQNNCLTSLEGIPAVVPNYIDAKNNQISSLKGAPYIVDDYLDLRHNPLVSLEGLPEDFMAVLHSHASVLIQGLEEHYTQDIDGNYEIFVGPELAQVLLEKQALSTVLSQPLKSCSKLLKI